MGSNRPLKIGIMLPESEREMAGETAGWDDLLAMTLQDRGARVRFGLVLRSPADEGAGPRAAGRLGVLDDAGGFAARTERIELGPFVTAPPTAIPR